MVPDRPLTRREAIVALGAGLSGCVSGDGGSTGTRAQLDVSPVDSLVDEPVSTRLTGLAPGGRATLWVAFTDADGATWRSYARFEADDDGKIDPADQAPLEGTYESRDPLGLLWSRRLDESDPTVWLPPLKQRFDLRVVATRDGDPIAEATVTRRSAHPDLRRVEPDHNPAVLFEPPSEGPHPGILILHGSGGEPFTGLAELFASHGYAAFALQYFGPPPQVPDFLQRVPLSIIEENTAWLRNRDRVSDADIGLIGWSRGGELALLAGTLLEDLGVVIGVVPSGLVFEGTVFGRSASAWSRDREEVPHIPYGNSIRLAVDHVVPPARGKPIPFKEFFISGFRNADRERIEAATIPVEEIDAPVVLFSGADDGLWPPRFAEVAERRREEYGLPIEHHVYEDAGHLVGSVPATVPTTQSTTGPYLADGLLQEFGGTPAANAAANADAWDRILTTFAETLR